MADQIEAVKKVTETLNKQQSNPVEEMERMSQNKEHFDSLMSSSQPVNASSFERLDTKAFNVEEAQSLEKNPVFGEENVSAQKKRDSHGSGTQTSSTTANRRS